MTKFASELPDFADLVRAVADWKKQRTAIIEKDYYLTRALHALCSKHAGEFVLKGGTSLTKGWNLLDRFSEDLDILVRAEAGWGEARRDTRLRAFRDTIASTKGLTLDSKDIRTRSERGVSRTAVYLYESVTTDVPGLGRNILFEAGYRGSPDQAVKKHIQSIVADYAAYKGIRDLAEDLSSFEIELQNVRRTFVEKGFAIHAAYQKDLCNNRMRHYYDLAQLCTLEEIKCYVGTAEYRDSVVDVRNISLKSFPDQAVPEGNSLSVSPAFTVRAETLEVLERNYKREAEIFFSEPPSLASIFGEIAKLLPRL